ncbi:hypothetical protein D3C78_1940860 [compost metagenome]
MDVKVSGGDFRIVETLVFAAFLPGNLSHSRPEPGISDVTEKVQILYRGSADFIAVGGRLVL